MSRCTVNFFACHKSEGRQIFTNKINCTELELFKAHIQIEKDSDGSQISVVIPFQNNVVIGRIDVSYHEMNYFLKVKHGE